VTRDVRVGRHNLDFSYWGLLSAEEQRQRARLIVREINAGAMPPWQYRIIHPQSRPTPDEARRLVEWISSEAATPGPAADPQSPTDSLGDDW